MQFSAGRCRFLPVFTAVLWMLTVVAVIGDERTSRPSVPDGLELQDGDTFVFLGDSITHQRLYTQYVETFFYTRFPDRRIRFHNAGVSGAQAWDALQRMQQDVADFKPKYVSILLGMNDGRYRPFERVIFTTYQTDMTEVVRQIRSTGASPILMSPTMFDSRAASRQQRKRSAEMLAEYNSVLAYYGRWLQHHAIETGAAYVDMFGPLNRITVIQRKKDADFTMIRDAIHPDSPGQVVMALAMIEQLGVGKRLSSIVIRTRGRKGLQSRVASGEVSQLKRNNGILEFDWTAEGLPWVLPESAHPGIELTHGARRVSRESLRITDLDAGQYEIVIDDVVVAKVSSDHLARRVELQSNSKTPQYQQALAIARLNEEKNNGPVKVLRDSWLEFQAWSRLKRSFEHESGNDEQNKRLAALGERMATHTARVADAQQQISEFDDQIYAANKPRTRHFMIRKVTE
ncbi:MAG: SGNH/GDSL hydrolase family protein [Fuerstiella sp.]|nr:SGNH/GDSL hydrolase family protein [Fuerstiella sp.]